MAKQSFLLVSLQEDKAKKLAQVVSNDSCRKILDYLAEKESTETELATSLQLPISTVHYNLKQLVDAGLVSSEEFHYSAKGKEVSHYRLANKYIIIAPKSTFGIKEKLKGILFVAVIVAAIGFAAQFFSKQSNTAKMEAFSQSAAIAAASQKHSLAAEQSVSMAAKISSIFSANSTYLWFIGGILLTIIAYLLIEYVSYKIYLANKK